ncbi:6-hydroxymethylpterin diphosphokinase MptE-like protein [Desulfobacter curvatus]|uniref:6-hydroxymethylpterin diphosphokinase MptE-like protein n=1 Tax=Desulfobacter curvatus TaxID=2290 RepID=UPI000363EA71|nr:6-hydroxymethylpterin diphosphokinase MptE-like protein [Desulfobacter curvatus]
MKIIVWGIGVIGKRLLNIFPTDSIVGYIDSNVELIGKTYNQVPVISFEKYLSEYSELPLLISPLNNMPIIEQLDKQKVDRYWILSEEPMDMYSFDERRLSDVFESENYDLDAYIIKGNSLYSLFLYDYLLIKNKHVVFLSDNDTETHIKTHGYSAVFNVETESVLDWDLYDELLIEDDYYQSSRERYSQLISCKCSTIDAVKKKYRTYPELKKFKGIHKAQRCVIVANGPSLTMDDLNTISEYNEISFGVNGIHKAGTKSSWRPDYYVLSDINYTNYERDKIIGYDSKTKFVLDGAHKFWEKDVPENVYKFYCSTVYSLKSIDVSDEIEYGIYVGMTVIHVCLQIAMYMGFDEIYLLGADTTSYNTKGRSHFIERSEYVDEALSKRTNHPDLDIQRVVLGYKSIKKFADVRGIRIYNATRGGALEVFERKEFDKLFHYHPG